MTLKGVRDGAYIAGLALIWINLAAGQPTDLWAALLVTVPAVMRVVGAMRNTKGDRNVRA